MHRLARIRITTTLALALSIALAATACSDKRSEAPASAADSSAGAATGTGVPQVDLQEKGVAGLVNRNASQLAYEHDVLVRLEAARIADNLAKVREACTTQRFGQCDLLGEELGAGDHSTGVVSMRSAPNAVAGLVGLAAAGGDVAQRSTRAEDLAEAVRDNGLRRKRLELQHAKLSQIMEHRDVKVEDLIHLTERLAMLEAELNAAEQEAAQQQRRIRTNLLTIRFQTVGVSAASSRIGDALRGLTSTWDVSIAMLITVVLGAMLPFLLLGGAAWWLIAKVRRRKGRG